MNMQIYGNHARFDTGRAMTEDELRVAAPSIFATQAHSSRSERFAPIPTIEIIRSLQNEGFGVVGARQQMTRVEGKQDFGKHLLRIRRMDNDAKYQVGDTVFEMLLRNANDGTAAYDLLAGLFRISCLNSVVAASAMLDEIRVRHTGDVSKKVVEASYSVLQSAETALTAPQDWSQIALGDDERKAFAESAHYLRFADKDGETTTLVTADQLLAPRRQEDVGKDLWKTFNVIQENALRGGVVGSGRNALNRRVKRTTRPINGIDQDVKLNKSLWLLAAKMAGLKAPAIAA